MGVYVRLQRGVTYHRAGYSQQRSDRASERFTIGGTYHPQAQNVQDTRPEEQQWSVVAGQKVDEINLEPGINIGLGYAYIIFKNGFTEEHLSIVVTSFEIPDRYLVMFVPGIMGSKLWLGQEYLWPIIKLLFKHRNYKYIRAFRGLSRAAFYRKWWLYPT
ncbi:MAG TPA: hypothetical protein VLA72_00660 [Anaerolineales bacterium]|nr:hypothetical protein [Anaerolineales bacterium]